MREAKVENYLRQRVRETGGFTRKCQWIGRRGAPDELCCWPGVHAFAETKRPSKDAEAHQAREHARLRGAGFIVEVIDTIEKVDAFVERMSNPIMKEIR